MYESSDSFGYGHHVFCIVFKYTSFELVTECVVFCIHFNNHSISFFCKFLSTNTPNGKEHGRTIISLFLFAYAFTPVIRTLTTSISTDTIYSTSIITAILSCLFHDYGVKAPVVSYPTSVSSGLSSAIFLLSRFDDDTPTLLLLVIAFSLHAYGAEFRNRLFHVYPFFSSLSFSILSSFSIYCISSFSVELSVFWTLLHLFILFICPLILIFKQTGKCTIHGPWDEAVPIKSSY
uniref:Adenosylcobinamide-GDP ribazoletransferase n=1 Tax=Caenorhabditis tropicalis TaxID=1561998 RepID=A0A1I7TGZ7_9PELO